MTKLRIRSRRCCIMRHQDERVCGVCHLRYDIKDEERPVCPITKVAMQ